VVFKFSVHPSIFFHCYNFDRVKAENKRIDYVKNCLLLVNFTCLLLVDMSKKKFC
jgi:hypothetical protein